MNEPLDDLRMFSVEDVINRSRLQRAKVYREMKEKRLKSVKAGGRRLIPAAAFREWMESLPEA